MISKGEVQYKLQFTVRVHKQSVHELLYSQILFLQDVICASDNKQQLAVSPYLPLDAYCMNSKSIS